MQESEFRDWARRQIGALEDRLKAVAAQRAEPAREELPAELGRTFQEMSEELSAAVRAGRVRGLGIAFVTEGGGSNLGFAATGNSGGYLRLAGIVQVLGATIVDEWVERQKAHERGGDSSPLEASSSSVAGAARGETDEGTPGARVVVDPAPAGGIVA